jgi:hypothetical protein
LVEYYDLFNHELIEIRRDIDYNELEKMIPGVDDEFHTYSDNLEELKQKIDK